MSATCCNLSLSLSEAADHHLPPPACSKPKNSFFEVSLTCSSHWGESADGTPNEAMVKVNPLTTEIDPLKCMGDWYVQVAWPTAFDRGASNGLERYVWDDAKQQVQVRYEYLDSKGTPSVVTQIGGVANKAVSTTEWWVKPKVGPFYLPFRLPYLVIDVDTEGYRWLTASSRSTSGFGAWCYIMTRDKVVDESFLDKRRAVASAAGWDLATAERMPQTA